MMKPGTWTKAWKRWAYALKCNTHALYLAARDPRVPLLAKVVIGLVVAYALSPIDLIPDFIPVIGYLDDLLLLPLGIWLAVRLVPPDVWKACQATAAEQPAAPGRSRAAAAAIVMIWLAAILLSALWVRRWFADGR